jgi:hypothetical protein
MPCRHRHSVDRNASPPSCRARRRLPICPETTNPDLSSASRTLRRFDRRSQIRDPGPIAALGPSRVDKWGSTRTGRLDPLALASAIPLAIARRQTPGRTPSFKSRENGPLGTCLSECLVSVVLKTQLVFPTR